MASVPSSAITCMTIRAPESVCPASGCVDCSLLAVSTIECKVRIAEGPGIGYSQLESPKTPRFHQLPHTVSPVGYGLRALHATHHRHPAAERVRRTDAGGGAVLQ